MIRRNRPPTLPSPKIGGGFYRKKGWVGADARNPSFFRIFPSVNKFLLLCECQQVAIWVSELKKLHPRAWTVQVVLDLTRFETLFIELFVRGCNVGS